MGLATSPYYFADDYEDFCLGIEKVGIPCVVKPVMSSSGKGQSTIKTPDDIQAAWDYAQSGGRAGAGRVIIEGFIDFDYEITLLTVQHKHGTDFCEPIGHRQEDGDYRESWQPQPMSATARDKAQQIAAKVTHALGGWGLFGVELFIKGDDVWFSEVSPRPHDTGMVTLVSQDLSEFDLHVRAFLGLPIPAIRQRGPPHQRCYWLRETVIPCVLAISMPPWLNPTPIYGYLVSPRSRVSGAWVWHWHARKRLTRRWPRRFGLRRPSTPI